MLRWLTVGVALGVMIFGMSTADAVARYCASYTGGAEKAEARSKCAFASLQAYRDSDREEATAIAKGRLNWARPALIICRRTFDTIGWLQTKKLDRGAESSSGSGLARPFSLFSRLA